MSELHKEKTPIKQSERRSKQVSGMVEPSLYKKLQQVKSHKDPHLTDSTLVYKLLSEYVAQQRE